MANEDSRKITAVLFDYGMVLSGPPDPEARTEMERILRTDTESLQAAYWRHRDAYDRGTLNSGTYWQKVAGDLQRTLRADDLDALVRADNKLWTRPNAPMIEWAERLQAAGIRTGILSNLGDAMETGIVAHFPWIGAFMHRTFSHRLGMAKPDLAIFRHAALGLGVPAGEILFIDDREENIAVARETGMVAVPYTGHDDFVQAMRHLGLGELLSPDRTPPVRTPPAGGL